MAFNFPNNPTTNDTHSIGDKIWIYTGTGWKMQNAAITLSGSAGSYANSAFDAANSGSSYANSGFTTANTNATTITIVGGYANSAFTAANNATDSWVRDAANSSSSYANSAFEAANNAVDTWVRDAANSASSYANSGFIVANTAYAWGNHAAQSYATETYVNTAVSNLVDSAPTTLDTLNELAAALGDDPNFATTITTTIGVVGVYANTPSHVANSASSYANSGYTQANTATTNAAVADQKAVTSGDYANAAYGQANTVQLHADAAYDAANNATDSWVRDAANSGSSYANSAYGQANTNATSITTVGDYANSAYLAANNATDSWVRDAANSASDYANSAFETANSSSGASASYLAVSAYTRTYTGDNSTVDFTISSGYSASDIIVTENGIVQVPNIDYTVSSTTLTFNTAPTNTVTIQIRELGFNSPFDDYARDTANAASSYANSAYTTANTKLSSSGGTLSGDLTINGNVNVSGCTSTFTVTSFRTSDHVIDLGYGTTGTPTQNAGIRVIRGDETEVQLRWIESEGHWEYTNNGLDYIKFGSESSEYYSNAAFEVANSASNYANGAFEAANNAVDTWVRDAANSASSYANSSYTQANTNATDVVTSGDYANSAYTQANAAYSLASAGGGGGGGGVSLGMLIALT